MTVPRERDDEMDATQYLVIRTLHLFAAALLVGGATTLWLTVRLEETVSTSLLAWAEAAFWALVSLLVFTGLGNLVATGTPPLETRRGGVLAVKFGVIVLLAVGSVVRSFTVVYLRRDGVRTPTGTLEWLYGLTAVAVGLVVVLAEVLVYG
ncbi:DUF2214 domain-containing protein [Natrarchaeobaculum aegyptiacum]|nr:DUF2214 domain-containing protein [Natrarchaeobaculum aegyptiacum]